MTDMYMYWRPRECTHNTVIGLAPDTLENKIGKCLGCDKGRDLKDYNLMPNVNLVVFEHDKFNAEPMARPVHLRHIYSLYKIKVK